jgi:hypothetical protein
MRSRWEGKKETFSESVAGEGGIALRCDEVHARLRPRVCPCRATRGHCGANRGGTRSTGAPESRTRHTNAMSAVGTTGESNTSATAESWNSVLTRLGPASRATGWFGRANGCYAGTAR